MTKIEEITPTRNELVPSTKFKSNVSTAVVIMLSIASAVGVTVSFKRDVEDIARRQHEEKLEVKEMRSQISVMHENMLRLAYSIDPKIVSTMKPLPSSTSATP